MDINKGVPAISRVGWVWALVLTFGTSGLFAVAIGSELVVVDTTTGKKRAGILWIFVGVYTLDPRSFLCSFLLSAPAWTDAIYGWCHPLDSIGLRASSELQELYAREDGSLPPMSILWTAVFSVFYLNYWLWTLRDTL